MRLFLVYVQAKKASRISVIGCEEEMQDLKRQLEEESAHRRQVEKELELQIQMKAESEMAAKLLEKVANTVVLIW